MNAFNIVRRLLCVFAVLLAIIVSAYLLKHPGWKFVFSENEIERIVQISDNAYQLDLNPFSPRMQLFSLDVIDNLLLSHAIRSQAKVELRENSISLTPYFGKDAIPPAAGSAYKYNRDLIFTTSDGSDPRINGNLYELSIFPVSHMKWGLLAFLLFMGGIGAFSFILPISYYEWAYKRFLSRYRDVADDIRTMKRMDIVFIVMFFLILLAPLICADFQGGGRSLVERRVLAKRPAVSILFKNPDGFIKRFDKWISDNIGFRYFMVNMHLCFYRDVLKSHYMEGTRLVLIGKQGHHFNTGIDAEILSVYQGKAWLSDEQLQQLSIKLNEIKRYLDSKNIEFILMFCADKETIYPEYYPDSIVRGPEPIPLDLVTRHLHENTNIDLFNIRECLVSRKNDYLVFPKHGTRTELLHHNSVGAFFAYQELMEHVAAYFPKLSPFSMNDVSIAYRENGSAMVSLKDEQLYERINPNFGTREYGEFNNSVSDLPVCLMLHDSYAPYFTDFLHQHFSKTIRHPWRAINRLEHYIDSHKPDVLIFEVSERAIPAFANAVIKRALTDKD